MRILIILSATMLRSPLALSFGRTAKNMRNQLLISAVVVLGCIVPLLSAADPPEIAVVVNKSVTLENISSNDLRLMILGEKPKWPDGKRAVAVQTSPESPERPILLRSVYKMSSDLLKRYYLQAAFTGKEVAMPKDLPSAAAVKQFVAANPSAIGCILASQVDAHVKVLKVDGTAPGEDGYKLR